MMTATHCSPLSHMIGPAAPCGQCPGMRTADLAKASCLAQQGGREQYSAMDPFCFLFRLVVGPELCLFNRS